MLGVVKMLNRTHRILFGTCLMLLVTANAHADVQVHVSVPAAEPAYTQGDIIAVEIELLPDGEPVAGVQLEIVCESDAVRIQDVDFSQAFPLVLGQEPAALPTSHFGTARALAIDGSVPSVTSPVLVATIKVEVMSDGPFTTHVQITAVASTIGRNNTGTLVQTDAPADRIPNGLRLRIENQHEG